MKHELARFLVVGILTVIVDYAIYSSLLHANFGGIAVCKTVGFIGGTFFAFFSNRYWTFNRMSETVRGDWVRFIILYSTTLVANVGINKFVLYGLSPARHSVVLAFLVATFCSAAMNFIGMKFFVFNSVKGAA